MSQVVTTNSDRPRLAEKPRTIGGEMLASFWQLGVLGMMSMALLIGIVLLTSQARQLETLQRAKVKQLADYRNDADKQAEMTRKRLQSTIASMAREVKQPTEAIEKFEAGMRAGASKPEPAGPDNSGKLGGGSIGSPLAAPGSAPGAAGVVPDSLIAAIRAGNWAGTGLVVQEVRRFGADEATRGQIRDACLDMLRAFKAGPPEALVLIDLAVTWNDKMLAGAVLGMFESSPAQYAGPQMFDAATRLAGVVEAGRVASVLPQLVNAQMMRQGGPIPDFVTPFPQAAKLASLAPPDAPFFGSLVVQDTPSGDLVRSALALKDRWPEEVTKELTKSFSNASRPINPMLMTWLEQCNCPPATKNALLPIALRLVSRQDDGDMSDELLGVSLIAFATNSESIGRVASGTRRLAEANPEVGKQLLLRLLLGFPQQTLPVFVQAAEDGRPILPPDPTAPCWAPVRDKSKTPRPFTLPCVELSFVRDFVDSIIAPALAANPPREWQRGLVIVAGDWGGPVTHSILNRADRQQVAAAQLTELVDAARKKIEARAKQSPSAPGVAS